jgi:aryl-alcohol dehydrogenase-like predicted oxidoreductase
VRPCLQRVRSSIARLGVTTLDMVQLHWEPPPAAGPPPQGSGRSTKRRQPGFVVAAKALQALQREGLVRQIGVSNFDVPMLLALLDAGVAPVTNQVSYSVIDRRPQLFMSRFCEQHEMQLLAYGTLAGGFLAERFRDMPADKCVARLRVCCCCAGCVRGVLRRAPVGAPFSPSTPHHRAAPRRARIDTLSKARYGTLLGQLGGWGWMQDMLAALHDIGAKHGVSASCVASRWVLQQRHVAAVIVGARNTSHIRVGCGWWAIGVVCVCVCGRGG